MIEPELTEKLADLAARIDGRIADLRERGEFSDVKSKALAAVRARRDELETRMEEAVAAGARGNASLIELRRDVDALVDDFEEVLFSVSARAERDRAS